MRDLGSTIKEAKMNGNGQPNHNISEGDEYAEDFEGSQ
jgi:hypothetical protein